MMDGYSIYFKESVEKDLRSIPGNDIRRILERIRSLADDQRPPGCEKLTGQERYRVRQGHYRILYTIQDSKLIVEVVKVGHRKDIYR